MTQEQPGGEGIRGAGLGLSLDAEGKALLATVRPVAGAAPIDESWLLAHLAEQGFGQLRYLPSAGTLLLGQYNSGAPVAALRIAECVDARCDLRQTPDGQSVVLDIMPAQGGAPLKADAVLAGLTAMGVTCGIEHETIQKAVAAGEALNLVVARVKPPVHGEDGRLEVLHSESRDRRPREDESGRIDYRDLGEITVVHPGEPLMRRIPATEGTPGLTLRGQLIPARRGKEMAFAAQLDGAQCAADDPNLLVAAQVGLPIVVPGGMIVEPVYSVSEVSTATGNIRFDGSVVIKGDVCAGMSIHVTGDIEVGGMVEAATLEAGGSIVIRGGVVGSLGRKEAVEHVVRCGGSFHAAYAQQARIEAGDSLFIDDTAMQCELVATNHILVGGKRRGHIIGGRAQATLSIKGRVLGSPNRVATHFEIGVDPALRRQEQEKAKAREVSETKLLEVSKLLDFARQHPGRLPADAVEKARSMASVLAEEIAAFRTEEESLHRRAELAMQSRVIAEQAMYEGVVVSIGQQRYRVTGEHGPGSIGLGKSGIGLLGPEEI